MFPFIKKVFVAAMTFFCFNQLNVISLKCVSMNNQECKTRTKIININNNGPVFYAVEVVIILMIHRLNCVYQMLSKI